MKRCAKCGKEVPKQYSESHKMFHKRNAVVLKPRSPGMSTKVMKDCKKRRPLTPERIELHKQIRRERRTT